MACLPALPEPPVKTMRLAAEEIAAAGGFAMLAVKGWRSRVVWSWSFTVDGRKCHLRSP